MGFKDARHFLARTGYGPTMQEVLAYKKLSPKQRADRALKGIQTMPTKAVPQWALGTPLIVQRRAMKQQLMAMDPKDRQVKRKALRKMSKVRGLELAYWWYDEMIHTKSPLTERLVFFWHDHFTTSARKVKSPALLYRQNQLFRQNAAGNFKTLLHGIAKDPAMILYLDNQTNRKRKPNENFARELLELFTLGEGHYTERDIKEAARAFTGWMANPITSNFLFNHRRHDKGQKTFMGKTGNFNGEDILNILLKNPRLAEHITERLWIEFIGDKPVKKEVQRLAKIFRGADYEIKPLLRAMFTSKYFLSPANYGTQIKSPIELIVGSIRLFKVPINQPRKLIQAGQRLGQVPFMVPSVKGWPHGTDWITTDSLYLRQQLMYQIFRDEENLPEVNAKGYKALLGANQRGKKSMVKATRELLLPIDPVYELNTSGSYFELLQDIGLDPAFQLK